MALKLLTLGRTRLENCCTFCGSMPADLTSSAVILSCSVRKSAVEPSTLAEPLISPVATSTKRAVTRTCDDAFW